MTSRMLISAAFSASLAANAAYPAGSTSSTYSVCPARSMWPWRIRLISCTWCASTARMIWLEMTRGLRRSSSRDAQRGQDGRARRAHLGLALGVDFEQAVEPLDDLHARAHRRSPSAPRR